MSDTMTPEEKTRWLEGVRLAATEGRAPRPEDWGSTTPRRPNVAQPGADSDDAFSAADLTLDLLPEGQEYQVPGTKKRLWIFGTTSDDTDLMFRWALAGDDLQPDPTDPNRSRFAQAKYLQDLKLAQVALCCRKGPKRDSPRCFSRADLPALRSRLGSSVVEEIVRISSDLSGSDEALGGSVRRFFACIRVSLLTSLSQSATWEDCPSGWRETQTQLASLVTRALSRGKLDSGLMSDLEMVEALL